MSEQQLRRRFPLMAALLLAVLVSLHLAGEDARAQTPPPGPRDAQNVVTTFRAIDAINVVAVSSFTPATVVLSSAVAAGPMAAVTVLNYCAAGVDLYCGFSVNVSSQPGTLANMGWRIQPSTAQPAGFPFPIAPGATLFCVNNGGSGACNAAAFYGR